MHLASLRALIRAAAVPALVILLHPEAKGQIASPPAQFTGRAALVIFAETASIGEISRALAEDRLRIVDGPLPGGFFKVGTEDGATATENETRLARFSNRQDILRLIMPIQ